METYFVITNSDGDTNVETINKEELLIRINDGYYGSGREVFDKLPKENDTNYWGDGVLIIKGSIVSPKPITKITEYTIE
jgi:hypothetical protein